MLDVIELSTLSIRFNNLLYLNLPPNLFKSTDLEYFVRDDVILVLRSKTLLTLEES